MSEIIQIVASMVMIEIKFEIKFEIMMVFNT